MKMMEKLCECGCGQPTRVATGNDRAKGFVKGQSIRFIYGHIHKKHGMMRTPEHRAFIDAKTRCTNSGREDWKDYGGRRDAACPTGVKFGFDNFSQFMLDVGLRPEGKDARGRALYSLDRINNDGHYEPGNVRWATRKEQRLNRRSQRRTSMP